jgi:membrane protein DedA with SNARE-associated domain
VNEILDWVINTVQGVDPALRNILAGLAIMLETSLFVGLVIPGDTVVLVASTGVQNLPDFFILLGCVLLGSLLGESFGFWIGRLFGERLRYSRLGRKIGESNWQLADSFIEARGGLAVAISRFLPVLHSLVPVVAGATKMRYRIFIRWTLGACAVWASAYVGVGYLAKSSYEQIGGTLKFGGVIFIGIILAFVVIVHFAKKRLEKSALKMVAEDKASKFKNLQG